MRVINVIKDATIISTYSFRTHLAAVVQMALSTNPAEDDHSTIDFGSGLEFALGSGPMYQEC